MNENGMIIETGKDNLKAMIWGWGTIAIIVGIVVIGCTVAAQVGLALTLIGGGFGFALASVGVGEGVRRYQIGKAATIQAQAELVEAQAMRIEATAQVRYLPHNDST